MEINSNILKITIWVSKVCNLRCRYCYEGMSKPKDIMSMQTAEETVSWIRKMMIKHNKNFLIIRFHGGEPMLNYDVIQYIIGEFNAESSYKVIYEMTTNAYKLGEKQIEYISSNIHNLSVSLDGIKRVHDCYRHNLMGEGTYDAVFKNAQKIKKYRNDITIRVTINSNDAGELYECIKFLLKAGFVYICVAINLFDYAWTMESIDILEQQCEQIEKSFKKYINNIELPIRKGVYPVGICNGGTESFQVDTNGDLFPCPYAMGEEYCLGNVISGINEMNQRRISEIHSIKLSKCDGCGIYDACNNTKCKFINKKIQGTYDDPIPLVCELCRRCI